MRRQDTPLLSPSFSIPTPLFDSWTPWLQKTQCEMRTSLQTALSCRTDVKWQVQRPLIYCAESCRAISLTGCCQHYCRWCCQCNAEPTLRRQVHVAWFKLWHMQGSISRLPFVECQTSSLPIGVKDRSWICRVRPCGWAQRGISKARRGHVGFARSTSSEAVSVLAGRGVKTYQCMRCHTFRLRPRPPCALRYPHHEAPAFPSQVQTRENHAVQHHQMSVTHVSGFSLQSHNVVPDPVYDEGLTIILSSLLFHLLLQEVWQLSHLSPLTGLPPCHPFRPIPYI